jgi:hypothetical protein
MTVSESAIGPPSAKLCALRDAFVILAWGLDRSGD